jgi:GNAT superfamily N-acetyltransferase
MPAAQRHSAYLSMRPARADEFAFAEALTRSNMIGYYRRHGLVWRTDLFLASWKLSENYIVQWADFPIGVLRIDNEGDALHVRDIHVVASYRGRGVGAYILGTAHGIARARRLRACRLRVFVDNPAQRLYGRLGYVALDAKPGPDGIRRMERPVSQELVGLAESQAR